MLDVEGSQDAHGRSEASTKSLNRRLEPWGCSVLISPMPRSRASSANAWRAVMPLLGRSMRWEVTWSLRVRSRVREVAPLTGQPWTTSRSGLVTTRR